MKYRYISDCHVHSDSSFDGNDSVVMLCENAVRMGLHAITITDHCDCNMYETQEAMDVVRRSLQETQKAAIMFRDQLQVFHGIELGQATQNLSLAEAILSDFQFDFVLGSLHNIVGMPDFYFVDYSKCDIVRLLDQYFEQIMELIDLGMFDSLAHLTYPLRYIQGDHNIEIGYEVYESHIDSILHALIRKDKALELNTSGLRQKIGNTLPCPVVIKRFHELGGKHVTLGSDAHRWADIGSGIETGLDILKNAGFEDFTIYMDRKPHQLPIA